MRLIDFVQAFLHAPIDGDKLILRPPQRFHDWLPNLLLSIGFRQMVGHPAYFRHDVEIVIHICDGIIAGPPAQVTEIKQILQGRVAMKDLDSIDEHGKKDLEKSSRGPRKVSPSRQIPSFTTDFSRRKGWNKKLHLPHLERMRWSPLLSGKRRPGMKISTDSHRHCPKIVGMLRWLVVERPDVMFDVNNVLENLQSPKYRLWQQVKRVVRYFAGTRDYVQKIEVNSEVILGKSVDQHSLVGWSDADFAGDVEFGGALLAQCSDWMGQTFTQIHAKRLLRHRSTRKDTHPGSSNWCASSKALCRPRLDNIGMRESPCCAYVVPHAIRVFPYVRTWLCVCSCGKRQLIAKAPPEVWSWRLPFSSNNVKRLWAVEWAVCKTKWKKGVGWEILVTTKRKDSSVCCRFWRATSYAIFRLVQGFAWRKRQAANNDINNSAVDTRGERWATISRNHGGMGKHLSKLRKYCFVAEVQKTIEE